MSMTFDATLKDLARDHPRDFLAAFDRPPTVPVSLLTSICPPSLPLRTLSSAWATRFRRSSTSTFNRAPRPASTPMCWSTTSCCTDTTSCLSIRS